MGRGCVDQIFALRLIIEKFLSHQASLVLSFIDYEQAFSFVDRRALAKLLSLHRMLDKYTKAISSMRRNNIAVVKVRIESSICFRIQSRVEKSCVLSPFT